MLTMATRSESPPPSESAPHQLVKLPAETTSASEVRARQTGYDQFETVGCASTQRRQTRALTYTLYSLAEKVMLCCCPPSHMKLNFARVVLIRGSVREKLGACLYACVFGTFFARASRMVALCGTFLPYISNSRD